MELLEEFPLDDFPVLSLENIPMEIHMNFGISIGTPGEIIGETPTGAHDGTLKRIPSGICGGISGRISGGFHKEILG